MGAPGSAQRSARLWGTPRRRARFTAVAVVALALAVLAAPTGAGAAPAPAGQQHKLTATPLTPVSRATVVAVAAERQDELPGMAATACPVLGRGG